MNSDGNSDSRQQTNPAASPRADTKSVERIIANVMLDVERGTVVNAKDVVEQYPEHRAELLEFFEMHECLLQPRTAKDEQTVAFQANSTTGKADAANQLRMRRQEMSVSGPPPRFLGDYEILEEIDRGGMGVVYKAKDAGLNRIVALKVIRSGELADQEEIQRFLREAEAAASLNHPGIVPIHEVRDCDGLVFYTMTYIEGQSLSDLVADGPIDPIEAVRITYKLCNAIEFAHRNGVYHRDLKPANVLINECDQPIIIDFGLAKNKNRDESLTATGQVIGTLAYMTPEHASGKVKNVGPAADVYALGAILFFLCTGQPPFAGKGAFDVLIQVMDRRPAKPSKLNRKVSREIDQVCLRMLEKDPASRYASASDFALELQRILTGRPIDLPEESLALRVVHWWQREPILVAHVAGIGLTTLIVIVAQLSKPDDLLPFYSRLGLLLAWLIASFGLQFWVDRDRWRYVSISTWLTADVIVYTILIAFARPPRPLLLIGYPMMIVASSLFYQRRYTISNTVMCILGFCILCWNFPGELLVRWDFSAIFICGMIVICLTILAMIHRVRGLGNFCEE
jgi:serine/threonine protein kinase